MFPNSYSRKEQRESSSNDGASPPPPLLHLLLLLPGETFPFKMTVVIKGMLMPVLFTLSSPTQKRPSLSPACHLRLSSPSLPTDRHHGFHAIEAHVPRPGDPHARHLFARSLRRGQEIVSRVRDRDQRRRRMLRLNHGSKRSVCERLNSRPEIEWSD